MTPPEVTTEYLSQSANAVIDGASVLVVGHVGDVVVWRDRVMDETAGLACELNGTARTEVILTANAADGLEVLDARQRPAVEQLLNRSFHDSERPAALGSTSPLEIARGIRALLAQQEHRIAVILRDPHLLLEHSTDTGRRTLATIMRAMEEARSVKEADEATPIPYRNALIVLSHQELPCLAPVRNLITVRAGAPQADALAAIGRGVSIGFHTSREITAAERAENIGLLVPGLPGMNGHSVEHARRGSVATKVGIDEPVALRRTMHSRRQSGTGLDQLDPEQLHAHMTRQIAGQDRALDEMQMLFEEALLGNPHASGLEGFRAPAPVLVLVGPPAIGKTEFARALQRYLSGNPSDMVRIDCALELRDAHNIAKLTGAPPGYIGHEQGGQLTTKLAEQPRCVFLLDEFDKMHPDIAGAFLSIIEDGRLNESRGRDTDFSQCIFIITSNHGSDELLQAMRDENGPPTTDEFTALARQIAERAISGIPQSGPPLWSRVQHSVLPYDMLRRPALPALVTPIVHNIEQNIGGARRIRLEIDAPSIVQAVDRALPPDGHWDGRKVVQIGGTISTVLTRPLIARLRGVPAHSHIHARVSDAGEFLLNVQEPSQLDS